MLIETDEWMLASLTEESDGEYRLVHNESGLVIVFDYAVVNEFDQLFFYAHGHSTTSFGDYSTLPDEIVDAIPVK